METNGKKKPSQPPKAGKTLTGYDILRQDIAEIKESLVDLRNDMNPLGDAHYGPPALAYPRKPCACEQNKVLLDIVLTGVAVGFCIYAGLRLLRQFPKTPIY